MLFGSKRLLIRTLAEEVPHPSALRTLRAGRMRAGRASALHGGRAV